MYVETVYSVYPLVQKSYGIFLHFACRHSQKGDIHFAKVIDIVAHFVRCQFRRTVFGALTAHDAGNLEIGGGLQGLQRILADVAVAYYGGSNLFHILGK